MRRPRPTSTLFPYTTLFRSGILSQLSRRDWNAGIEMELWVGTNYSHWPGYSRSPSSRVVLSSCDWRGIPGAPRVAQHDRAVAGKVRLRHGAPRGIIDDYYVQI